MRNILFLGNIIDLLKLNFSEETIALTLSDTIFVSKCDDVNFIELKQATFDELYVEVYDKNTTQNNIDNYIFPENWNEYTVLHATFNNGNLAAGNFDYMISEVHSLIIKRRIENSVEPYFPIFEKNIYTNTNEFSFVFNDYLVKNKTAYEYILVPILKNGIEGKPIRAAYENEPIVDFDGIFICEPDIIYSTVLNLELTAQKNKPSSIIAPIGTKCPFVLCGTENNYYTGTVKGLFAQYKNNDYDFENAWDYRENLNNFLLDGKTKILKYYDGRMWLANIYGDVINEREGHDNVILTSFNWCETGDISDMYKLYDNGFISYNPYTKSLNVSEEYDYSDVIYTAFITTSQNIPIAGAIVKLCDNNKNIITSTTTDSSGQFLFNKLQDGDYYITVSYQGFNEKSISLTVENHKAIAEKYIILYPQDSSEDSRKYYTTWKVLKSTENENFEENELIFCDDNIPALINTGRSNSYVILESDFSLRQGDCISLSICGTYENDNASEEEISAAGFPQCRALIYTGVSSEETSDNTENNYNELSEVSVIVRTNTEKSQFKDNISKTISSETTDLKLMLFAEHFDTPYNNLHSIIETLSISVNGIAIFEMR